MKNLKSLLMIISIFLLFSCEDKKDDEEVILNDAPGLVSSDPYDGEINIMRGSKTITLTFDQNIILTNSDNIKLNDEKVIKAEALYKKLTIETILDEGKEYILNVPEKTIKGPTGIYNKAIKITFSTKEKVEVTTELVVGEASKEAINVFRFLRENFGKNIITGTMSNVSWNWNEAKWVHQHTGKYPVINGCDYLHLAESPANWIDYSDITPLKEWWDMNGIVTLSWHWNVPVSQGSNDRAFYAKETNFNINQAVIEGTYENDVIMADLEKISGYIKLLKDEGIPVLWRPLHEASGGWFWWGKNAESCKKLWIIMFEFFQKKELNNLIWVWTTQTKDDSWYPGDAYVDIIGRDIYNNNNSDQIASEFKEICNDYSSKLVALSECGTVSNLKSQISSGAMWSWAMPWYDYNTTNQINSTNFNGEAHEHADITWWKESFSSNKVLDLSQVPSLK